MTSRSRQLNVKNEIRAFFVSAGITRDIMIYLMQCFGKDRLRTLFLLQKWKDDEVTVESCWRIHVTVDFISSPTRFREKQREGKCMFNTG